MRRLIALVIGITLVLAGCTESGTIGSGAGSAQADGQKESPPAAPQPAPKIQPQPTAERWLFPAYVYDQGKRVWGYLDEKAQWAVAPQFESAGEFGPDGLAVVQRNAKYGLINKDGKVVLETIYDWMEPNPPGGVRVAPKEGTYRLLGADGRVVLESKERIGTFSEGLAPFYRTVAGKSLYGFIDTKGNTVIEPQFLQADPFRNGRALVKVAEGEWAVIDPTGKQLGQLRFPYVGHLGEDLAAFQDKASQKWGFASITGQVVIPATFSSVTPFENGVAEVNAGDWSKPAVGLINRKGEFVLGPSFGALQSLGEGLYGVAERPEYHVPEHFLPMAISTLDGRQLTDFAFYTLLRSDQGVISATDERSTFFLDKAGKKAAGMPVLDGIGTMRVLGPWIRADIDQELVYLTREGRVAWRADRTEGLNSVVKVTAVKYRPHRNLLVYYSQLSGFADAKVQQSLNTQLKALFVEHTSSDEAEKSCTTMNYGAELLKGLLVVHHMGYIYPIGAAHGMPVNDYHHFDISTGARYKLADLFKKGSPYSQRLTEAVQEQLAAKPREMVNSKPVITANHRFTVRRDGLLVYFYPYEIAAYAAGFQEFVIPWNQITDLINTEGAFWKAFH